MDNKEKIIELLKNAIESCEKYGAMSIVLSINHKKFATNMVVGNLEDIAQAFASQDGDIEGTTIPLIGKAIGIAKIIY